MNNMVTRDDYIMHVSSNEASSGDFHNTSCGNVRVHALVPYGACVCMVRDDGACETSRFMQNGLSIAKQAYALIVLVIRGMLYGKRVW